MFKRMYLTIATVLLSSVILVSCGTSGSHGESSTPAKTSSSTSQIDVSKLDMKTVGALALKEIEIEKKDDILPHNRYYYVEKSNEFVRDHFGKDTYGFTANGDGLADISYTLKNGIVGYAYLLTQPNKPAYESKLVVKKMSLQELAQKFYKTKQQKQQIDQFVQSVIPNSYYGTKKDYPR